MKKILLCACFLVFISSSGVRAENILKKISVVTTIFPLYDFIRTVGGGRVDVRLLIAPGVEPHMYEPTPADIAAIDAADIFIYTGDGMEPWVARLLPGITNQNLLIVDASQEAGVEKPGKDPHVWLDFAVDQKILLGIADALSTVDSGDRSFYQENAKVYQERLAALDAEYNGGLRACQVRTVIYGGHVAFDRLAERYGLKFVSPYSGFSPDAEPTPQAIVNMVNLVRSSGVKKMFFEELVDPKVARVVAEETGATLELLHAAHNISADEMTAGVTFVSIMEENLRKLREGLMCP